MPEIPKFLLKSLELSNPTKPAEWKTFKEVSTDFLKKNLSEFSNKELLDLKKTVDAELNDRDDPLHPISDGDEQNEG